MMAIHFLGGIFFLSNKRREERKSVRSNKKCDKKKEKKLIYN